MTEGSDNLTTLGSDYPNKSAGLSDAIKARLDYALGYSSERLSRRAEFKNLLDQYFCGLSHKKAQKRTGQRTNGLLDCKLSISASLNY